MAFKSLIGATCACLTVVAFSADAALVSRLGGLAYYDDVADLTWLADANAAGSARDWINANQWASRLVVDGNDNWRLATSLNSDNSGPCDGRFNICRDSEMGNLFYNVLGGMTHNSNYDLFSNVQSGYYWSTTRNANDPLRRSAWRFNMGTGRQDIGSNLGGGYAWAVQSGDVSPPVPVPAAVWLFGSGLIGLIGVARRKKA